MNNQLVDRFEAFLGGLTKEEFLEKWEAASNPDCNSPLVEDVIKSFDDLPIVKKRAIKNEGKNQHNLPLKP